MQREDQIKETKGMTLVFTAGALEDLTQILERDAVPLPDDDAESETSGIMEFYDWLAGTDDAELKHLHRSLCPGRFHARGFFQSVAAWREKLGLEVWAAM